MGDTGAVFVAMPQISPRNVAWMKKGTSEPIYEKYIIKAPGINRLV